MRRAALVAVGLLVAGSVAAQERKRIEVKVVDQAGGIVFLEPGEAAGLRVGMEVTLGKRSYPIKAVTATSATIAVGDRVLRLGSRGRAVVSVKGKVEKVRRKPAPLSSFAGQWPETVVPAASQTPTPVPIGKIRRRGRSEVAIRVSSSSLFPIRGAGEAVARVSVRARLRAEPFRDTPFGLDADVEAGRWFGRGLSRDLGAGSRPTVEVQELRLRYGDRDDPYIGLGRLRYASRSVGLIDGVRTSSPRFGGVSVFAFGGVVPSTLDGAVDTSLSRFGAGASYLDLESAWRPSAEVSAYGSMFDGDLDERRVAASFRLFPGAATVGGHAELSGFAADNPWGARRVELTAAGVDAGVSHRRFTLSASFDAQQPERSLWLQSLLPPSWLCTAEELPPGSGQEPCDGGRDVRYFGLATAGLDRDHLAVRVGGTATLEKNQSVEQSGGFVDVHLIDLLGRASVELGTMAARSNLVDSYAARLGASSPIGGDLDVSVYYRPAVLLYRARVAEQLEHRLGGEIVYSPAPSWGARLSAEAVAGDVTLVGVFATAVWRGGF